MNLGGAVVLSRLCTLWTITDVNGMVFTMFDKLPMSDGKGKHITATQTDTGHGPPWLPLSYCWVCHALRPSSFCRSLVATAAPPLPKILISLDRDGQTQKCVAFTYFCCFRIARIKESWQPSRTATLTFGVHGLTGRNDGQGPDRGWQTTTHWWRRGAREAMGSLIFKWRAQGSVAAQLRNLQVCGDFLAGTATPDDVSDP